MASRLFHTVVAVGIALSSAACAAPGDETSSDDSALTTADGKPDWDAFCDRTWPTTKGGSNRPPPACIDPKHECERDEVFFCAKVVSGTNVCSADELFGNYSVCIDGTWRCKPGRIPTNQCASDSNVGK